jgi:predicted flap endonuclease-1-like 5' DNA nuclease
MYKLNPDWPSDNVSINGVSIDRNSVLDGQEYEKWTKPTFVNKPPMLIKIKEEKKEIPVVVTPVPEPVPEPTPEPEILHEPTSDDKVELEPSDEHDELRLLDGVGPVIAKKLGRAGYTSYKSIIETTPIKLAIDIGRSDDLAEKIINSAKEMVDK